MVSGQQLVTSTFKILFLNCLERATNEEISKESKNLQSLYSKYFTEDLESQLQAFANGEMKERRAIINLVHLMLEVESDLLLPQVYKASFLFAAIPVAVPAAERSFSNLKLIKIFLRFIMTQERLLDVSNLSIENEEVRLIEKGGLIDTFVRKNTHRCRLKV